MICQRIQPFSQSLIGIEEKHSFVTLAAELFKRQHQCTFCVPFFTSLEYCRHYENTHRKLKGNKGAIFKHISTKKQKFCNLILESIISYSFYEVFYRKIDSDTCQTYAPQRISEALFILFKNLQKKSHFHTLKIIIYLLQY